MNLNTISAVAFSFALSFQAAYAASSEPAGSPGIPHRWAPALKQAVGTAYERTEAKSPVWFTVAEGILTEVFYPYIDQTQVGDLQFIVTDGKSFFSEQKRDTVSTVKYADDGATVLISGRDRTGRYSFEQAIVTDVASPVVRIKTSFQWHQPGLRVHVLFKPAINNTGSGNIGHADHQALYATKKSARARVLNGRKFDDVFAALTPSVPFTKTSVGYVGFSDGWQDLNKNFQLTETWKDAGPGNIALTGELEASAGSTYEYEIALGFGPNRAQALANAQRSLQVPFRVARGLYDAGWMSYLDRIASSEPGKKQFMKDSQLARLSAMTIKMHEDKKWHGAIVASLSKPGIPGGNHAEDGIGGYHLIWPRDLYHAGMGLLAAGDFETPVSVLRYYVASQKEDGSWAQNYWVDGTPYWKGIQMDEIAFPIVLAAHLEKRGVHKLAADERLMVKKAAEYLIKHGPVTQQDRWEEIGGYVPSTLASEIAALRAATQLTGDKVYAGVAQDWSSKLESWTVVPRGPYGNNYFLRTSLNGNPSSFETIHLANGAGSALAPEILDGGFLELVRLGIRDFNDPNIVNTMKIYEDPALKIATGHPGAGNALGYRRYNRDGYGESGVGGYWPLLAGERGHYSVAAGDMNRARAQLFLMERAALPSGMIPEQTVDVQAKSRAGLGVACPLVWAHAEDILLHRSIEEGTVFDAP